MTCCWLTVCTPEDHQMCWHAYIMPCHCLIKWYAGGVAWSFTWHKRHHLDGDTGEGHLPVRRQIQARGGQRLGAALVDDLWEEKHAVHELATEQLERLSAACSWPTACAHDRLAGPGDTAHAVHWVRIDKPEKGLPQLHLAGRLRAQIAAPGKVWRPGMRHRQLCSCTGSITVFRTIAYDLKPSWAAGSGRSRASTTSTAQPRCASAMAARAPPGPAPTTTACGFAPITALC
jgi:hypothetical protein